MATFVLIHGGGGTADGWGLVRAGLEKRGHGTVAMDLPCDDPDAGWTEYTDAVVEAVGNRTGIVVVAHSAGGFVAPLVCERLPARQMVFVSGMVPAPGEAFMEWWTNTGYKEEVDPPSDPLELYYHDVPRETALAEMERENGRENFPSEPWPLDRWPDTLARYILCRDDRLFPAEFMRRVVSERLDLVPDEMDGGHMVILSRPEELVERLNACVKEENDA